MGGHISFIIKEEYDQCMMPTTEEEITFMLKLSNVCAVCSRLNAGQWMAYLLSRSLRVIFT